MRQSERYSPSAQLMKAPDAFTASAKYPFVRPSRRFFRITFAFCASILCIFLLPFEYTLFITHCQGWKIRFFKFLWTAENRNAPLWRGAFSHINSRLRRGKGGSSSQDSLQGVWSSDWKEPVQLSFPAYRQCTKRQNIRLRSADAYR